VSVLLLAVLAFSKITIGLAFFLFNSARILRVAQVTQSMPAFMYLSVLHFIRYQVEVCGMCWQTFFRNPYDSF
jgi:hypothetical protein